MDGILETTIKALVDKTGKIPASWKMARVALIPKSGRDPTLTSSFRPISVLPELSKVSSGKLSKVVVLWEHTFKNLLKKSLGLDPFHDQVSPQSPNGWPSRGQSASHCSRTLLNEIEGFYLQN